MTPLILLLVALWAPSSLAAPPTTPEVYHVCVAMHEGNTPSCSNVTVCHATKTILYTREQDEDFAGMETLEDFNVNLGASCVEGEGVCYIKELTTNFTETVAILQENNDKTIVSPGGVDIQAVEYEDGEVEEIGEKLMKFCEGKNIIKLEMATAVERQVNVSFTRCFFFLCLFRCATITITIPTGGSFVFVIG